MTLKKKRILIVTSEFPPQPGGIGNHAHNLALYLSKHHYSVTVVSDSRSKSGTYEARFDETLPFKMERITVKKVRSVMYFKRLQLLKKHIPNHDIVLATGKFSLWSVGFFSLLYSNKYIAVIHGSEVNLKSSFAKCLTNSALKKFEKLIAVSNYTKGLIEGLNLNNIVVIPNGYNANLWDSEKLVFSSTSGYPMLVTVGRISERKGQHHVISKIPYLLKKYPEIQYHCIGIDTESGRCIELARKLNIEKHVTIHGEVSFDRLKDLLIRSHINIMLSAETKTGDVEGFGIAIIEANALGIPAIGSKNSGIEDAILDGETGVLINHNSQDEFEEAITMLLEKKDYFRLKSKEWAKRHTWDTIINRYIKVLESE